MTPALLVLLATAVHVAVFARLGPDTLPAYRLWTHVAMKLVATAGCLWAAASLRRGDYMRRFWVPLGVSYFLLTLAEDPITSFLGRGSAPAAVMLGAFFLAFGNLLSVGATAVLARSYRQAGLGFERSWRGKLSWALAALFAVGVVGFGLDREASRALAGEGPDAWASAFSYLCDAVTFVLLVPVIRFSIRLGASRLGWPWWTYAAATVAWLLYDAIEPLPELAAGLSISLPSETFRTLGTLLAGLAGLYAADLVRRTRAERPPGAPST